ncbi:MAG TPA: hypothetical protein VE130_10715 [Nitrososphaeraceae archaeon]|nr:hypothetical protein [Nitrososphaeraceae archaeon]
MRYSYFFGIFVFVSAIVIVLYVPTSIYDSSATSSNIPSNDVTGIVQLGAPFYEEHYSSELGMPKTSNQSFTGNFTGEGILNGNLSVSAEGNATGTLRDNDTLFLHGDAKFVSENEDTAVYSFDAFTNYNPDGSSEGSGIAVFDERATGELSFLSNTLAIYKNRIDSNGNATFLMWHWK